MKKCCYDSCQECKELDCSMSCFKEKDDCVKKIVIDSKDSKQIEAIGKMLQESEG